MGIIVRIFFSYLHTYTLHLSGTVQHCNIHLLMPADYSTYSATFSSMVTSSLHPYCQTGEPPVFRSVRLMSLIQIIK